MQGYIMNTLEQYITYKKFIARQRIQKHVEVPTVILLSSSSMNESGGSTRCQMKQALTYRLNRSRKQRTPGFFSLEDFLSALLATRSAFEKLQKGVIG